MECSLNVNVFLGQLHQCETLKNNPLTDNMNHQARVSSPLNTSFTISMATCHGTAYKQSPAHMSSSNGAGFVIRWASVRLGTFVIRENRKTAAWAVPL